jgi:hypothetical protein
MFCGVADADWLGDWLAAGAGAQPVRARAEAVTSAAADSIFFILAFLSDGAMGRW